MIPNFQAVEPGTVFRGGQPETQDDWDQLKALGVTQVIKLNLESEGSDQPWLDMGGDLAYFPEDTAQQLLMEPNVDDILRAVTLIKPVTFVHCKHGQDRTGLLIGAYRLSQGWGPAKAFEEMREKGFHELLFGLDRAWFAVVKDFTCRPVMPDSSENDPPESS